MVDQTLPYYPLKLKRANLFPAQGDKKVNNHPNNQVMLEGNTRLEITGTTVTKTNQTPLPGDSDLLAFCHPYYLTVGVGGGVTALWELEGTRFT